MRYLQEHVSLRSLHTFGLSVTARWLHAISSEQEALEFLADNQRGSTPMLILGGGSNVLFQGDYPGLVLLNRIMGIEVLESFATEILVRVGAGENWHAFVQYALKQGWYGLENLSLIPGTVGASPIQNIGAYGVEIQEVVDHVEAMHLPTLQIRRFSREECRFGYRDSYFKQAGKGKYLITRVVFRLSKLPQLRVEYAALQEALRGMEGPITPEMVSEAVIHIRQSKLPDPALIGNAGSFFKNPEIPRSVFEQILVMYPQAPHYPIDDHKVKVPAAWLIETCGWKGYREGGCGVHDRQALVLVNHGGATGKALVELSDRIMTSVQERFHIQLEREVQIV